MSGREEVARPQLSAIVACTRASRDVEPILSSLHGQAGAGNVEIIVDGEHVLLTEENAR